VTDKKKYRTVAGKSRTGIITMDETAWDELAWKKMRKRQAFFLHHVECGRDPSAELEEIFTVLSERELKVLNMRWGLEDETGHTLQAVAQEFGYTRERVRQIELKAIRKLQEKLMGDRTTPVRAQY